jgi:hypothetical protein
MRSQSVPVPSTPPAARATRAVRALAVLRRAAPRAVPHGTLIHAMWSGEPPASTAAALTSVVHGLRGAGFPIERVRGGYRLRPSQTQREP